MSRSIHTTRRCLERAIEAPDAEEPERQERRIAELRAALETKRRIKDSVAERRSAAIPAVFTPPEGVPIEVEDEGPYVHHPASPEDIRAVLARLPPGALDGLTKIQLSLGAGEQPRTGFLDSELDVDPFVGRRGYELYPKIYVGSVLGQYHDGDVRIYAAVHEPDHPQLELLALPLRMMMLSTLVHELAHHDDRLARVARGRWRFDDEDKVEEYARRMEREWLHDRVVPYLEERYPADVERLISFVAHHGGVRLPLQVIAGDPSELLFRIDAAVAELVSEVAGGAALDETRLSFADALHMAELYDEALAALAAIRAEAPGHLGARVLEADIRVHQERYDEAEAIVRAVLAEDPTESDAWDVLADVARARKAWPELIIAVSRFVETTPDSGLVSRALAWRAYAKRALGDLEGAAADIAAIDPAKREAALRALTRRVRYLEYDEFPDLSGTS